MLTADDVRRVLDYDPETGDFRWAVDRFKGPHHKALCARKGDLAGSFNAKGYRQISVCGRNYGAQRLAWLVMTGEMPTGQVDHIDRDPSNNRWSNLRDIPAEMNMRNRNVRSDNKLGVPGVYRARTGFAVHIGVGNKQRQIGTFATLDEAITARRAAQHELHGSFAGA